MAKDTTTLAESAQAIFCSLADILGSTESNKTLDIKKYKTFESFLAVSNNKKLLEKAIDGVNVDAEIKDIFEFLSNTKNGWYVSSVIIAKSLVQNLKDVDRDYNIAKKERDYFYLRGKVGVMKDIGELWSIATKSEPTKIAQKKIPEFIGFKDINKWNPADIYLANKVGERDISQELQEAKKDVKTYSFDFLNEKIKILMDKGALLPLSLKKTRTSAKLVKVNFVPASKDEVLKTVKFTSTTDWKPYVPLGKTPELSFDALRAGKGKTVTRDIRIMLTAEGKQGEIKVRHDPSGNSPRGRLVIEVIMKGDPAKGGSIASEKAFHDLWKVIDPAEAKKFLDAYEKGVKEFARLKTGYMKIKEDLRSVKNTNRGDKNKYDHYLAIASATNIINGIMPIVKKWFNDNNKGEKGKTNKLVRLMFQIASSRSPLSSRFVIAK
jgi:hypothetical protein